MEFFFLLGSAAESVAKYRMPENRKFMETLVFEHY